MTTLQKAVIGAVLAAAVGVDVYEVRLTSRLREQVQTLRQQQAPLAAQAQQLTRERDGVSNRLAQAAAAAAGKTYGWEVVESPDYRQYIANLRAVGCPEETLRDIIRADVRQLYEHKKQQLRQQAPKVEYWKGTTQQLIRGAGQEMWGQMPALEAERNALLRSLGIEPDYKLDTVKQTDDLKFPDLDFLQDENKKAQVLAINKELSNRMAMRTGNEPDDGRYKRWAQEAAEALRRVLTPEELFQYQLRASGTASDMRREVEGFNPTEQEYIAVFKLRKAFDDEFPSGRFFSESEGERAKRAETEKQMKEQIQQALGAERYADYEMARDHDFQQMLSFTEDAKLGVTEAKKLYLLRRQAEEQVARVREDETLTPEMRASTRESLRQQTEKTLQSALGEKNWEQFNQRAYNWWLDRIYKRPVQPSTDAPR